MHIKAQREGDQLSLLCESGCGSLESLTSNVFLGGSLKLQSLYTAFILTLKKGSSILCGFLWGNGDWVSHHRELLGCPCCALFQVLHVKLVVKNCDSRKGICGLVCCRWDVLCMGKVWARLPRSLGFSSHKDKSLRMHLRAYSL